MSLNKNYCLTCISMPMARYETCRKFGEDERGVRVTWGGSESNSDLASWEDLIEGLWLAKFGVLDRWLLMGGGGVWDVVTHVGLTVLLQ